MDRFELNLELLTNILVNFLKEEANKVGFTKVVLGVSGGIDSALVAFLAAKAFGPENVLGIMMPYKTSSKESVEHAKLVIEKTGIRSKLVEITPMVDAYFALDPEMSNLRKGNKMARERMSILFDHSALENALVLGTSNKTELLLGYSTQFGDGACAINPIADLYKAQVWALSEYLGVPQEIVDKKPSADLWEGQTDEQDLGYSYRMADEVLHRIVEERKDVKAIVEEGFDEAIVKKIIRRMQIMQYKRMLPVFAKVTSRAVGHEFKYPRDWKV